VPLEDRAVEPLLKIFLWWFLRLNSQWVLALGRLLYKLEISGRESLPTTGPLILVCRHSSRIESVGLAFFCSLLKEFHGLAAGPVIVNSRLFARLSRTLGILPAFKERGLSGVPLIETLKLLRQGGILIMAADGEVPWDGRLQPLRPGAAWLALRSHAPVVATMLHGAYDIWPRWASRPHLTGKLVLKIGKPFYLADGPCQRVTSEMIAAANQCLMAELEALSAAPTAQTASALQEHP
jgi:1-acyl-sn-glycerol-3-phosphate acyltransferase